MSQPSSTVSPDTTPEPASTPDAAPEGIASEESVSASAAVPVPAPSPPAEDGFEDAALPLFAVRQTGGAAVVAIPADLAPEACREWARAIAPALAEQLGGRPCRLDLGTRELDLFEVRRLLKVLREPHGVDVTGLHVSPGAIHRYAEKELKLDLHVVASEPRPSAQASAPEADPTAMPGLADVLDALGVDDAPATFSSPDDPTDEIARPGDDPATEEVTVDDLAALHEAHTAAGAGQDAPGEAPPLRRRAVPVPDLEALSEEPEEDAQGGRRTLTLRRTIRSGTEIRYERDIVVLGDVNSGASVVAGGNVLVLGRLRGVVHAGAPELRGQASDDAAVILAFELTPTQLRIGHHIAIVPDPDPSATPRPEVATVRDGEIVIQPWTGRLPR